MCLVIPSYCQMQGNTMEIYSEVHEDTVSQTIFSHPHMELFLNSVFDRLVWCQNVWGSCPSGRLPSPALLDLVRSLSSFIITPALHLWPPLHICIVLNNQFDWQSDGVFTKRQKCKEFINGFPQSRLQRYLLHVEKLNLKLCGQSQSGDVWEASLCKVSAHTDSEGGSSPNHNKEGNKHHSVKILQKVLHSKSYLCKSTQVLQEKSTLNIRSRSTHYAKRALSEVLKDYIFCFMPTT